MVLPKPICDWMTGVHLAPRHPTGREALPPITGWVVATGKCFWARTSVIPCTRP
jgi:hypothetical protein